jgi:hypothetical protein
VPVSAPEFGFGGLRILADDAALDAGASLADESMDVKCAGNSGVLSLCLDSLAAGAKNAFDPMPCAMLAGNAGVAKVPYCIGALEMALGARADDHCPRLELSNDIVVGAWNVWLAALVVSGYMP